jgi:hypothetical protein
MRRPGVKPNGAKAGAGPDSEGSAPEEFGEECGGGGGVPYEVFARPGERIRKVTVWHREFVDGIELETDQGVLPRIGGTGKSRDIRHSSFEIQADEFLTGVSIEFWNYIDRVTFHTNNRSYGPYGGLGGHVKKSLQAPNGRKVVGFKGRHWALVDSLQLIIS